MELIGTKPILNKYFLRRYYKKIIAKLKTTCKLRTKNLKRKIIKFSNKQFSISNSKNQRIKRIQKYQKLTH